MLEKAVTDSAARTIDALKVLLTTGHPLEVFAKLKFDMSGYHPTADRPLNLIEQINQTFTYFASIRAARWLLKHHPSAAPFKLNLGTVGGTDIESLDGSVAAETFASVDPKNNSKLEKDIAKVASTSAKYKYVFYICPSHPIAELASARGNAEVRVISLGW